MYNIAVIGAGYWGKKHIEEYIALNKKPVVIDKNIQLLKQYKDTLTTYNSYENILKDKNIQVISICTPNNTHYHIAKDCLLHGKNILVEKPISMSINETLELIRIAKDKNLVLFVGHIFRFNNAINKLKEMIYNHELGEIRILKFKWTNTEPLFADRDVIYDLAVHPLDIINYLFNKTPNEISCIGNAYRRDISSGTEAVFINCIVDEIIINIELSWLTPPKTRDLVVIGSNKSATIDCTKQQIKIMESNKEYNIDVNPNNTIRDELKFFLECIENKTKYNISNGNVGLDIIKMIEACQKSLNEKRVLKLEWK